MLHLIVYVFLGSRCEFFIWNDEPTNELLVDDAFSTGTGLERSGIVGSVGYFWMSGSSAEIRNK